VDSLKGKWRRKDKVGRGRKEGRKEKKKKYSIRISVFYR
jgi:hypothetical protein